MTKENNQTDVFPINGPSTYSFTLSNLAFVSLSDWPPYTFNKLEWKAGLNEFGRHLTVLKDVKIWSPYPILSFCVASAVAPIPDELLSPIQRTAKQVIAERDDSKSEKLKVSFFLFPTSKPEYQSQAVAKLCCESKVGESVGKVRMWVDALRENELSDENMSDIRSAANKYRLGAEKGLDANSIKNSESEALFFEDFYNDGLIAFKIGDYDTAISLFDESLCREPQPELAILAYWNLAVTILTKFRFQERNGENVSNEEMKWCLRMLTCAKRVIEIYESHLKNHPTYGEDDYTFYQQAKALCKSYAIYGSVYRRNGVRSQRNMKDVANASVKPLKCIAD